ncbi:hypothetical protein V6N13_092826 [Hibiscus sabdariffa]
MFDSSEFAGHNLVCELRCIKKALKKWNSLKCDNFDKKAMALQKRINDIEELGDVFLLDAEMLEELKSTKIELWDVLKAKEDVWRQKSRLNWIKCGDANSFFFIK